MLRSVVVTLATKHISTWLPMVAWSSITLSRQLDITRLEPILYALTTAYYAYYAQNYIVSKSRLYSGIGCFIRVYSIFVTTALVY